MTLVWFDHLRLLIRHQVSFGPPFGYPFLAVDTHVDHFNNTNRRSDCLQIFREQQLAAEIKSGLAYLLPKLSSRARTMIELYIIECYKPVCFTHSEFISVTLTMDFPPNWVHVDRAE